MVKKFFPIRKRNEHEVKNQDISFEYAFNEFKLSFFA